MTVKAAPYSYDEVPYPSYAYPQTHPDNLAVLAILSGMEPPPVEQCRVLELGCGSGGNLIPMAYSLPHSQFLGIDLSGTAISEGQQLIAELGLQNITLKHQNILDVEVEPEQFDYVIAYGIYSWVPSPVRHKILQICRTALVENGVAYVSYNTYPGWRMNYIIRDMLAYHTRRLDEAESRIQQARAWLDFLVETVPTGENYYGHFLNLMYEVLKDRDDSYLFHDFMEDTNDPLYFHQFVEQARQHELKYLANAELSTPGNVPPEVTERILAMTEDRVEVEQYTDFLTNRTFRESLLCHQELSPDYTLNPDRLRRLLIASQVTPVNDALNILSDEREEFRSPEGAALSTAHPLTKAALLHLAEVWPRSIPFDTLVEAVRGRLAASASAELTAPLATPEEVDTLATNLLMAYSQNIRLVSLHTFQPHFVTRVSQRPVASPIARYQNKRGYPLTNQYHYRLSMSEITHHLLPYLDGNHDLNALLDVLVDLEANDILDVTLEDNPVEDPAMKKQILANELSHRLQQMAWVALLVE